MLNWARYDTPFPGMPSAVRYLTTEELRAEMGFPPKGVPEADS